MAVLVPAGSIQGHVNAEHTRATTGVAFQVRRLVPIIIRNVVNLPELLRCCVNSLNKKSCLLRLLHNKQLA